MQNQGFLISLTISTLLLVSFLFSTASVQQDDAFIFYTYAQNVADGHGYVFNEGERVNATTSSLYTVLLAFAHILLPSFIALPKLGHLIGILSLGAVVFFGTDILLRSKLNTAALFFGPLFLLHPFLISGVGMETFLVMALSMGAVSEYVRSRYNSMAVFAALAVIARPDAILFPFIICIDYVIRQRRFPEIQPIVIFTTIVGAVYLLLYQYFGSVLPSTLAAKVAQTESGRWGEGYIFFQGFVDQWPDSFLGGLWMFMFIIPLLFIIGFKRTYLKFTGIRILLHWSLVYLVAYGFILNPPAYPWYYTPLVLLVAMIAAVGFEVIALRIHIKYVVPVLPAVLIMTISPFLSVEGDEKYRSYVAAAEWLQLHASEGAHVATNEVGVLGYYYTKGPIIDGLGLVTPSGIDDIRDKKFHWYIDEYRPEYLVLLDPPRAVLESYVKEAWFDEQYEKVHTIKEPHGVGIYRRFDTVDKSN